MRENKKKVFENFKKMKNKNNEINAQDEYGCTQLHDAVLRGDYERCKYLIEQGADVNMRNNLMMTPLHDNIIITGLIRNIKIEKLLIDAGADINAKDKFGYTPSLSCHYPKYDTLRF